VRNFNSIEDRAHLSYSLSFPIRKKPAPAYNITYIIIVCCVQRKKILINYPKYTGARKIFNNLSSLQQYFNEDAEATHFYYTQHVKACISYIFCFDKKIYGGKLFVLVCTHSTGTYIPELIYIIYASNLVKMFVWVFVTMVHTRQHVN